MVTLDKEFAEEKCETLELELEGEREKVGGLEDDVLALEEVNAEYERPPEEGAEKSSVAFVQLEKHNERLKEALIRCVPCFMSFDPTVLRSITEHSPVLASRLRDMSSEAERDHRSRITALEKDLADTSGLQGLSSAFSLLSLGHSLTCHLFPDAQLSTTRSRRVLILRRSWWKTLRFSWTTRWERRTCWSC